MRLLHQVSEDEVLTTRVRGESTSDRFGVAIRREQEQGSPSPAEVLAVTRGWPDIDYFEGFPGDVEWWSVVVTRTELLDIVYIEWDYWLEVSGGTRRPVDAIQGMSWGGPGLLPSEVEPIIVVSDGATDRLVVLEGHARLTNFVIARDRLPDEIPCLLGRSPNMASWACF